MSKIKLLYIIPCLQIGGAEVALLSAIPSLNKHYDLSVVSLGKIDKEFISDLTEDEILNKNYYAFVQLKEGKISFNVETLFNILNIDQDDTLDFNEFFKLVRSWQIFTYLTGGIYSNHPNNISKVDVESYKNNIGKVIVLNETEIEDLKEV